MFLHRLRHTPWLGTVLRVLVLCFALGTLAHAGHTHAPSQADETHYNCDLCTSFGGVIDAPVQHSVALHAATVTDIIAPPSRPIATRPVGIAQARAPPAG